jgi:hypothetical protein
MEEHMKRSMVLGIAMVVMMLITGTTIFAAAQIFSGKIMMVDPKLKIFMVKASNDSEMTFHVGKGTEITIGGATRLLGQLYKGEDVTVTYTR